MKNMDKNKRNEKKKSTFIGDAEGNFMFFGLYLMRAALDGTVMRRSRR
jgi:hypothetical protein